MYLERGLSTLLFDFYPKQTSPLDLSCQNLKFHKDLLETHKLYETQNSAIFIKKPILGGNACPFI